MYVHRTNPFGRASPAFVWRLFNPLVCLMPAILALRDEMQEKYGFETPVRVGAAGGIVLAGLIQVNARIPADTPRGATIPVQLTIGSATSQGNVFLATRP